MAVPTETVAADLDRWTLERLPRLNSAVLDGSSPPEAMAKEVTETLAALPDPDAWSTAEARRVLVHLSLSGASLVRHYQERGIAPADQPALPLSLVPVGTGTAPFADYFVRLASRPEIGHPVRDSYAALVRWNTPTAEVRRDGEVLCRLPGVFGDDSIRTYTGEPGEAAFLVLLKKAEALELAANTVLLDFFGNGDPAADGGREPDLLGTEAVERMHAAGALLAGVHRLNLDFPRLPAREQLRTDHFMDVLRQFATHWSPGDIPPSGAQDVEYLKRDLILGIDFPDYFAAVRRQFPALLAEERAALLSLADRTSLPARVLAAVRDSGADPARTPALAACYFLLQVNARVSASHFMLTEKYLFKPHRLREEAGLPDGLLVSHQAGTTGIVERTLRRLLDGRKRHALTFLDGADRGELLRTAGLAGEHRASSEDTDTMVRFTR
ncbi:hypothetical protein [Streptomyces sp. NPDC054784]